MATLGMQTVAEDGPDGQPRIVQQFTVDGVVVSAAQFRLVQQQEWDANMQAQSAAAREMDASKAAAEAGFVTESGEA